MRKYRRNSVVVTTNGASFCWNYSFIGCQLKLDEEKYGYLSRKVNQKECRITRDNTAKILILISGFFQENCRCLPDCRLTSSCCPTAAEFFGTNRSFAKYILYLYLTSCTHCLHKQDKILHRKRDFFLLQNWICHYFDFFLPPCLCYFPANHFCCSHFSIKLSASTAVGVSSVDLSLFLHLILKYFCVILQDCCKTIVWFPTPIRNNNQSSIVILASNVYQ